MNRIASLSRTAKNLRTVANQLRFAGLGRLSALIERLAAELQKDELEKFVGEVEAFFDDIVVSTNSNNGKDYCVVFKNLFKSNPKTNENGDEKWIDKVNDAYEEAINYLKKAKDPKVIAVMPELANINFKKIEDGIDALKETAEGAPGSIKNLNRMPQNSNRAASRIARRRVAQRLVDMDLGLISRRALDEQLDLSDLNDLIHEEDLPTDLEMNVNDVELAIDNIKNELNQDDLLGPNTGYESLIKELRDSFKTLLEKINAKSQSNLETLENFKTKVENFD